MSNETVIEQTDINAARMLAQWANGWPELDPNRLHDRLFQTTGGGYFLARHHSGGRVVEILPLEPDEARQWAEEHCDAATTARLFD